MYFNPESSEDTEELESLLKSEAIGDTLYDRRWVLNVVMKLAQNVKESKDDANLPDKVESDNNEENVESNRESQDTEEENDLESLVEMTFERDVCLFLVETGCFDVILSSCQTHCENDDLILHLLNVVHNVFRHSDLFELKFEENKHFLGHLFASVLFSTRSAAVLTSLFTLWNVIYKHFKGKPFEDGFLYELFQSEDVVDRVSFVLVSTTNEELLGKMSAFLHDFFHNLQHWPERINRDYPLFQPSFSQSIQEASSQSISDETSRFHFNQVIELIRRSQPLYSDL